MKSENALQNHKKNDNERKEIGIQCECVSQANNKTILCNTNTYENQSCKSKTNDTHKHTHTRTQIHSLVVILTSILIAKAHMNSQTKPYCIGFQSYYISI